MTRHTLSEQIFLPSNQPGKSHIGPFTFTLLNHIRVAPNVEFLIEDAEDEWIGSKYDYIHIRMLSGALKDWPAFLEKAYNHLNPGGWIELTEFEVWVHSQNDRMGDAPEIQSKSPQYPPAQIPRGISLGTINLPVIASSLTVFSFPLFYQSYLTCLSVAKRSQRSRR